jgi:hypothetical protein
MVTALEKTGEPKVPTDALWVSTPQEVSIEAVVIEGESAQLRGGDRLLAEVQEDDVVTGVTVSFTNARFSAKLNQLINGGPLIMDGADIVGYDAPSVAAQGAGQPVFRLEVYAQNFSSKGQADKFVRLTLPYCKGRSSAIMSASDREWSTPTFEFKGMESPIGGTGNIPAGPYRKEFVATAPSGPED